MPTTRILITGANGALGRALAAVVPPDVEQTFLARSPVALCPPGRQVLGDIVDIDWSDVTAGCSTVFHLAAFVHRRADTAEAINELHAVNWQATRRLARHCREAGKILVFASTVAVFGPAEGVVDDSTSPNPITAYGISKKRAEDSILEESVKGLRYSILRFPLLYGPGGRGNMERMLQAIARGRYLPIGDQRVRKTCLFFCDAARALLAAQCGLNDVFVVAPAQSPTLGEIHSAAYDAVRRRKPWGAIPVPIAVGAARTVDACARLLGRPTHLEAQVRTLTSAAHFDGDRFVAVAGYQPQTALAAGLDATARWLENGSDR